MTTKVTTQSELTAALARGDSEIIIDSPAGVWLGATVTAPDWSAEAYCGNGLHFSPSPAQARDYHREATRFLKCAVKVEDLVILDGSATYTTPKLKARAARVLCEVDVHGDEL